jgi:hypothetical protein
MPSDDSKVRHLSNQCESTVYRFPRTNNTNPDGGASSHVRLAVWAKARKPCLWIFAKVTVRKDQVRLLEVFAGKPRVLAGEQDDGFAVLLMFVAGGSFRSSGKRRYN